ncbi:nuclear transport factor 2 family protein [Streptomyces albofaciens JCM 4342]|uniref:nuclear transport factor 2 family protein n=1 Tax=Streptomyces albofaciens TaxID=66866 RepID=UPI0012385D5E|nr:nuclear transport factor 2 family protein [Streptomyces albofaciens]KAA6212475.1 nuclear transport factor 2 family protein [Streptomyces albofaciens JCM 4342]
MTAPEQPSGVPVDAALHQEIQHFYGRQMRYLDEARVEEWAGTFTEDGVFVANAHPEPSVGRAAIAAGARKAAALLAEQGVQRRHWLGMLEADACDDGTVRARTYALIISTPRGGQAAVHLSTSCDDVLVREDGQLRVRHREVRRDDLRPE